MHICCFHVVFSDRGSVYNTIQHKKILLHHHGPLSSNQSQETLSAYELTFIPIHPICPVFISQSDVLLSVLFYFAPYIGSL